MIRRCFYMQRNRRRTFVNASAPEVELKSGDFADNLTDFIAHLKYLERSDYTIEYYRRELRKFMHTLEDMRFKTDLRAITGDLIEGEYIRYMSDEVGVKHATIAATLRALRAFLDRKTTRLNSSHVAISYAVFCL